MRVVQINAVYGVGSTGNIVRDIGEVIEQQGGESLIAYQKCKQAPARGYRIGSAADWKLHAALTRLTGRQAYFSKIATCRFLRYLDDVQPDVVHLHNLHSNYIDLNLLLKYLAQKDIPTVVTLHDCWFFTGKCFHFAEDHCEKWKTACSNCPRNKKDVPSLFFDASSRVFQDRKDGFGSIRNLTVVGCSEWISGLAKESAVFQNKNVVTIRNGVDTTVFSRTGRSFRKEQGLEDRFVVLGMANKWCQPKNKEAAEYLISHLPENGILVLPGCTAEQKEVFCRDQVLPLGFIRDRSQLADLYSSADVFVNLTHADTLPTVNIESICCGTPVITYDSCGSPELVQPGVSGAVVAEGDYAEIGRILQKTARGEIRFFADGFDPEVFDSKKSFLKYWDLYHKITEAKQVEV